MKKIDTCYNNPDLLSTTKINQHIPSGYSIYTNCSFDKSNNKLSYYRGQDCMKRFCKDLKDHATKIIDFKKKTMIPLTKEEEDNYNKENTRYIVKKVLIMMVKYGIIVISLANIGEPHILVI